ncbi:cyclin-like protein [Infundibulicybe gibba]|nr:cyclin-like protein [Infundibulicybe gibba]
MATTNARVGSLSHRRFHPAHPCLTTQIPQRNRALAHRAKVDENAISKHVRHPSSLGGGSRFAVKDTGAKSYPVRQALGEVTLAAVNRKDAPIRVASGKEKEEVGSKRGRSNSTTFPQRVPLGPGRGQVAPPVSNTVHARAPLGRARIPLANKRASRPPLEPVAVLEEDIHIHEADVRSEMDVEEDLANSADEAETEANLAGEEEVESMVGVDSEDEGATEHTTRVRQAKTPRVWPQVSTDRALRYKKEIDSVREVFGDEVDMYDTTMVSEYSEDIFEYMCELEEEVMPSANYMAGQNEITWAMRQTLVDWLLQVHLRYHLLPETLWIAVNIVDRFLSKRVVSLVKLQLVGVTAMFIAAKYEEILAPSVDEFVFMTENGYTKEEILKGERIVLQTLEFRISHYCSPYSWMRKISKADDYDIQTRTLSKFLTEATLLDHRFLRVKPSLVAAVGMYCARRMLGGDWNEAFIFYSGFTEEQLLPGHEMLVQKLTEENFAQQYVYKKYAYKKFLKASVFAVEWASVHVKEEGLVEGLMLQQ